MKKMMSDFHIHSYYSPDSLNPPCLILKLARKCGLDIIAITDHDTIKGGLAGKKYMRNSGIEVIVGAEILTDAGDIIGLNLTDEIRSRQYEEVIEEIHNQGGLVTFPHPFRGHKHIEQIAHLADFIEIWNGRSSPEQNEKALELSKALHLKKMVGSDAHLPTEIGNARALISDQWLLQEYEVHPFHTYELYISQSVKRMRKKFA